jgi:hypothetical protein
MGELLVVKLTVSTPIILARYGLNNQSAVNGFAALAVRVEWHWHQMGDWTFDMQPAVYSQAQEI